MRRLFAATAAVLVLFACGGAERPEGIVERWLTSLNQGKAGRPELYASDSLSQQIVPDWEGREPGELDLIEVGRAGRASGPDSWYVPFRVEFVSGQAVQRAVIVSTRRGAPRVVSFTGVVEDHLLPSEGGPTVAGGGFVAWLAAIGVAALLVLGSSAIMSVVRRRTPA
jgi:hypothetical protein